LNPPIYAKYWTKKLGAEIDSLTQLRGGINNQVFRCGSEHHYWVIKTYRADEPDKRDRMKAEVDFLRYSASVAPNFTPAIIEVDRARRCVVMEHISGEQYPEGASPSKKDIEDALRFLREINGSPKLAREMIQLDAADGFLSLRQHMDNVYCRLALMGTVHLPHQYKPQAQEILDTLYKRAEIAESRLEAKINAGMVADSLDPSDRCISPSDFGFHNAIRTSDKVKFIDFEFAGWDDPAKACVDFVLQQRNPVHLAPLEVAYRLFREKEERIAGRIDAIFEILRLKWLCIILGVLNPTRLNRMLELGDPVTIESIIANQLRRYREYMAAHSIHQQEGDNTPLDPEKIRAPSA
jgi:hypothetical protein